MKRLLILALLIPAVITGGVSLGWLVWRLMWCCPRLPKASVGTVWVCKHGHPWKLTQTRQIDQRYGPPTWTRMTRRAAMRQWVRELHADLERMNAHE